MSRSNVIFSKAVRIAVLSGTGFFSYANFPGWLINASGMPLHGKVTKAMNVTLKQNVDGKMKITELKPGDQFDLAAPETVEFEAITSRKDGRRKVEIRLLGKDGTDVLSGGVITYAIPESFGLAPDTHSRMWEDTWETKGSPAVVIQYVKDLYNVLTVCPKGAKVMIDR